MVINKVSIIIGKNLKNIKLELVKTWAVESSSSSIQRVEFELIKNTSSRAWASASSSSVRLVYTPTSSPIHEASHFVGIVLRLGIEIVEPTRLTETLGVINVQYHIGNSKDSLTSVHYKLSISLFLSLLSLSLSSFTSYAILSTKYVLNLLNTIALRFVDFSLTQVSESLWV